MNPVGLKTFWLALGLIFSFLAFMIYWASVQDAKRFKNPLTRKGVFTEIPKEITDKELFYLYLRANIREASLFIGGLVAGLALGGFLWLSL